MYSIENLKNIPSESGVYIMKDMEGKIIYIGKAVNLKNRVRSYFRKGADNRYFANLLGDMLGNIETIVTRNETEALMLEGSLIRKHRPCFNMEIRSEGFYLYVRINTFNDFPRYELVRKKTSDKSLYFGPFQSPGAIRKTSQLLIKVFGLRTCPDSFFRRRKNPCIEYQMGRCLAPCTGLVSREKYRESVDNVIAFLSGRKRKLFSMLKDSMLAASDELNFELAAKIRDLINSAEAAYQDQVVILPVSINADAVAVRRSGNIAAICLICIREGIINSVNKYYLKELRIPDDDILPVFFFQHYMKRLNLKDDTGLNNPFSDCMLPDEIIVQGKVSSPDSFSDLVKSRTGKNIKIRLPRGKMRKKILDLAQKNAEQALDLHVRENEKKLEILRNLTEECGLRKIPVLIECYDISNIQGTDAYGSMAVFRSGIPCKKEYRCFKIRQKQTPDDYMMMEEVLSRRFSKDHFSDIPDLVVIDGGIAHLGIAEKVLSRTGNDGIDVIAIAKERRNEKPERIYIHGRNAALIPENQDVLHMLMRIRDEAHRFALRLHRKGREKTRFVSPLDNIPGMGKKRKKALMLKFGSLKNIMEADVEELASVKQINKGLAERIHEFFHGIA